MTHETDHRTASTPTLPPYRSQPAPFVYFDLAVARGHLNGLVEVELGARILAPTNGDMNIVSAEIVPVAHLRSSLASARYLREILDAAIKAAENADKPQASDAETEPQAAAAPPLLN